MKWRFAVTFLTSFALLLVVWWWLDIAAFYRMAVLRPVQLLSPLLNGWRLEVDQPGPLGDTVFRSGDRALAMLLQLPALSMGLVPLLSLVLATPGLGTKQAVLRAAAGALLYYLLDVAVILAYPWIMDRPNVVKDTLGVFTGLLAFVVAPLGLWFIVTYSALRPLWQLTATRRDASPPSSVDR
jgi:hypothetical protein